MKHELYNATKDSVLSHTEVDESMLLICNKEECVDARCLLVCALSKCGLKDAEIASLTSLTRPCVCKLRNSFAARNTRMFLILWKRICADMDAYMLRTYNESL